MKKNLLSILFCCCLTASSFGQSAGSSTPLPEYAMLHIVDDEHMFEVEYSNAVGKTDLSDTLKIDTRKESLSQAKYKCFRYLNKQGYQLVSSSSFSYETTRHDFAVKYEYVFRKN